MAKKTKTGSMCYIFTGDFDEMIISDNFPGFLKVEIRGPKGTLDLHELDKHIEGYQYISLDEYEKIVQRIKELYLEKGVPFIKAGLEERRKENALGNPDTMRTFDKVIEEFKKTKEIGEQESYYRLWEPIREVQQWYQKLYHREIIKLEREQMLEATRWQGILAAAFGEWIIWTQGGHWKKEKVGYGNNGLVLVHPQNPKVMIDLRRVVFNKQRNMGDMHEISYEKDSHFWDNVCKK